MATAAAAVLRKQRGVGAGGKHGEAVSPRPCIRPCARVQLGVGMPSDSCPDFPALHSRRAISTHPRRLRCCCRLCPPYASSATPPWLARPQNIAAGTPPSRGTRWATHARPWPLLLVSMASMPRCSWRSKPRKSCQPRSKMQGELAVAVHLLEVPGAPCRRPPSLAALPHALHRSGPLRSLPVHPSAMQLVVDGMVQRCRADSPATLPELLEMMSLAQWPEELIGAVSRGLLDAGMVPAALQQLGLLAMVKEDSASVALAAALLDHPSSSADGLAQVGCLGAACTLREGSSKPCICVCVGQAYHAASSASRPPICSC